MFISMKPKRFQKTVRFSQCLYLFYISLNRKGTKDQDCKSFFLLQITKYVTLVS